MNKIRSTKGITLIALVVTVIVLLILAGVTIRLVVGEEGIIGRSQNSTSSYKAEAAKEEIGLAWLACKAEYMQEWVNDKGIDKSTFFTAEKLNANLGGKGTVKDVIYKETEDSTLTYASGYGNVEYKMIVSTNGKVSIVGEATGIGTPGNPDTSGTTDTSGSTDTTETPDEPVISDESGASTPNLNKIAQKEYVTYKWEESENKYKETLTSVQPDDWYDYENGKWANIKTTNNGLEAYWVWIPRYEYKITNTSVSQIDVKFIDKGKVADAGYTIHPALRLKGMEDLET